MSRSFAELGICLKILETNERISPKLHQYELICYLIKICLKFISRSEEYQNAIVKSFTNRNNDAEKKYQSTSYLKCLNYSNGYYRTNDKFGLGPFD